MYRARSSLHLIFSGAHYCFARRQAESPAHEDAPPQLVKATRFSPISVTIALGRSYKACPEDCLFAHVGKVRYEEVRCSLTHPRSRAHCRCARSRTRRWWRTHSRTRPAQRRWWQRPQAKHVSRSADAQRPRDRQRQRAWQLPRQCRLLRAERVPRIAGIRSELLVPPQRSKLHRAAQHSRWRRDSLSNGQYHRLVIQLRIADLAQWPDWAQRSSSCSWKREHLCSSNLRLWLQPTQ
jgi:hypothetical protein